MSQKLRMAVIGAGRMGGFHARVCHEHPDVDLLGVVDLNRDRAAEVAAKYGVEAFASADTLAGKLDAVVVAVPTTGHVDVAEPLLARGVACLVEKPLAVTAEAATALVRAAEEGGAVLQVGHTERFNPAFMALGRYKLAPRFIETERISPCRFRSMDVGVVMDMMIHDIDLVLSMVRSEVTDIDAVGINVLGTTEDMANVRVRFANGAVADMMVSRAAMKVERRIRVFADNAYAGVDFNAKQGVVIRPGRKMVELLESSLSKGTFDVARIGGEEFQNLLETEQIEINEHDALGKQLESFILAVQGKGPVVVSGDDGRRAVDLAIRIVDAIRAQPVRSR
ncbi:MAG: Gfo/Idh/MocA family oxidoreductase [Planctomycetes bacterium]|nr:Gfo/Idh/MocA family oxidoreductase [Planctomycetota bacterium]